MKIKVVSDLHLEFGPITIENNGADVLILSGDICVAHDLGLRDSQNIMGEGTKSKKYYSFFEACCNSFPHVIYVAGNHEHYHGDYATTLTTLRERLSHLNNLYILDKEVRVIDDVVFVGGTLWTDMNKRDPNTMYAVRSMMNDYRLVENTNTMVSYRTYETDPTDPTKEKVVFRQRTGMFSPEDSVADHENTLTVINQALQDFPEPDRKFVVVGHHAPSKQSTKPRYQNDVLMNGAYSSNLTEIMLDNPRIKLWTHGHTHHNFDYMVGSTRIVCNPRGYDGYELNDGFDPTMLIEV